MTGPRRIQHHRGRNLPPHTRLVARPTRFGNPHKTHPHGPHTPAEAVTRYETDLHAGQLISAPGRTPTTITEVHALAGWDLACYCPLDQACHADVLLRIANQKTGEPDV
jgi:hypothetical protein